MPSPAVRWVAAAALLASCGPNIVNDRRSSEAGKYLPATLEAQRPREGDPKPLKVRIYVDTAVRATAKWREEITDQLDYASQLLSPLASAQLTIESVKEWARTGDPGGALAQLTELDKADDVAWVIGYVAASDVASKAMSELGNSEPLGRHIVVRGWADHAEREALAAALPALKDGERTELYGAHRRHKQTVVLLHWLAVTMGAIDEADPTWIGNPSYAATQKEFSERNRELITLAINERALGTTNQNLAKRLLDAIEKSQFGGWIPTSQAAVTQRLRTVIDATKAGRVAEAIPAAAVEQFTRIKTLARQGKVADALIELDNLLAAYPGNAAMHQLRCELQLASKSATAQAACDKAGDLAPGDPTPHLLVAESLVAAGNYRGARAQMQIAEGKLGNLKGNSDEAWRKLIASYQAMGSLTWTEDAIAKAKLADDSAAISVRQTRARYGIPRGAAFVVAEDEAALVGAIRSAQQYGYATKYGDAERTLATAEKRWRTAPGLAAVRCEIALAQAQLDTARSYCAKAIAGDPDHSWALYLSAVLAFKTAAGTATGIQQLKRAIAVDPELAAAWRALAKAYQTRTKDRAAYDQLAKDYQAKFGQPLPP